MAFRHFLCSLYGLWESVEMKLGDSKIKHIICQSNAMDLYDFNARYDHENIMEEGKLSEQGM